MEAEKLSKEQKKELKHKLKEMRKQEREKKRLDSKLSRQFRYKSKHGIVFKIAAILLIISMCIPSVYGLFMYLTQGV